MKIKQLTCALLLTLGLTVNAANTANPANTVHSVAQVTEEVTLSTDVDYVITSTTPFASGGKVNITNTEHAVLIIQNIRPSIVISSHLKGKVFINGAQAVDGENCQVKMYAQGSIIMPYGKDFKPLTVYSEPDFGGTAVNDFGLEHSGGFMNTLSEEKLNNQIRSFKLKRGYMVTFATGKSGWGYSRCFIADNKDLEIKSLPAHLDARISSYRVFQWYDAQKKGLASDTREVQNGMLGTSWCYDWATGFSHLPDRECVPHQIYVAWPSASACGSATYACHMKTNNEPGNSADDQPQSVEVILDQWQTLMRTGMRLCSESSHDGSWAHLDQFIAEVDRRGWRCDILDLHCYWSGGFDNMKYYYEKYGNRPIWISEFVWGASWNNNGIFATDRSFSQANQQKNLDAMKGILTSLNNSPYVERYAYWNSEADCSKLLRGESEMSLTGNYYRDMNSGMAYRSDYEKIPVVAYTPPSNVTGEWKSQAKGIYELSWEDTNFDLLNETQVQRRMVGESQFEVIGVVEPIDQNGKKRICTYQDTIMEAGEYEYRVVNITAEDKLMASSLFRVAKSAIMYSDKIQYGEISVVSTDENKVKYVEPFAEIPAVFMGALSNKNSDLLFGNLITLSGESGFTYVPHLWETTVTTEIGDPESIPFMAIAEGNYRFSDLDCEVGTTKVRMDVVDSVLFATPFPEDVIPVVLTEIYNPVGYKSAMMVKVWDISHTGFKYKIVKEEQAESTARQFNVSYMAITPGVGSVDYANGLMIAAGRNAETISGTRANANTFTHKGEELRFVDPFIFANLQTNNYDAATLLRRNSNMNDATKEFTVGARFRRMVDASCKTASDGTTLNSSLKDDLGWVVLYERLEGTSDMNGVEEIPLKPYVEGRVIRVDGCEDFEVYNAQGVRLSSATVLSPGIYVVKAGSTAVMVLVK